MTQSANSYAVNVSTNERTYNCRLEDVLGRRWLVVSEMVVTAEGYQRVGEVRLEIDQIRSLAGSFEEAVTFLAQYAVVAEAEAEEDRSPATIRSRLLQHGLLEDLSEARAPAVGTARNGLA